MKVCEILNEAISMSGELGNVRKQLVAAIGDTLKQLGKQIETDQTHHSDLLTVSQRYLSTTPHFKNNIKRRLWTLLEGEGLQSIKFEFMGDKTHGQVEMNSTIMVLNSTVIEHLTDAIVEQLVEHDELGITPEEFSRRISKPYTPTPRIWKIITRLSETIVHEMVHVAQHARQVHRVAKGQNTELRSYLTKDTTKFYQALKQLTDKSAQLLYYSSPQEIPAHAHNMAIHLIDLVSGETPIDEMRSTKEVQTAINNLDRLLKSQNQYVISDTFKRYKTFNQPDKPQMYNIYKRFLKRVYQEIMSYRQQLQNRLDQL